MMSRVRCSWVRVLPVGLLLIRVVCGEAQTGVAQRGFPIYLLGREPVRKEIDLGKDQQEKIAKIESEVEKTRAEFFKKYEDAKKALAAEHDENAPAEPRPDDRARQIEADWRDIQIRIGVQYQTAVRKTLRPEQVRRLLELEWRQRGPEAFSDPRLAAILNIDEAKFIEIQGIIQQSKEALRPHTSKFSEATKKAMPRREDGTSDREKYVELLANDPVFRKSIADARDVMIAKTDEVQGRATQKILSVLTRRQRETYIKLLGEPFERSKLLRPVPGGPAPAQEPAPEASPAAPKPPADAQMPPTKTLREQRGVPN